MNGVQQQTCVDVIHCNNPRGKPAEQTRACLSRPIVCTDIDRDGYGEGPDCLGRDANDNDPAVTSLLLNEPIAPTGVITPATLLNRAPLIAGIIVATVIILIVVLILAFRKKAAPGHTSSSQEKQFKHLKNWAMEGRKRGYSYKELRAMLEKKGLNKKVIDEALG